MQRLFSSPVIDLHHTFPLLVPTSLAQTYATCFHFHGLCNAILSLAINSYTNIPCGNYFFKCLSSLGATYAQQAQEANTLLWQSKAGIPPQPTALITSATFNVPEGHALGDDLTHGGRRNQLYLCPDSSLAVLHWGHFCPRQCSFHARPLVKSLALSIAFPPVFPPMQP